MIGFSGEQTAPVRRRHLEIEQQVAQRNLTLVQKPFDLEELVKAIKHLTEPEEREVSQEGNQENLPTHSLDVEMLD